MLAQGLVVLGVFQGLLGPLQLDWCGCSGFHQGTKTLHFALGVFELWGGLTGKESSREQEQGQNVPSHSIFIVVYLAQEHVKKIVTRTSNAALSQPPITPAAPSNWLAAAQAAEDKKAENLRVLDLRDITSFTEFFVVCTGTNQRQNQAISDEVYARLKDLGELPISVEGYDHAEWVLMDYGDFIVHVFSEEARKYYDIERLWRDAKQVEIPA